MHDLKHLIYASKATRPIDDDELEEILAFARRANHANEVTGLLLHISGYFFQVLEGEAAAVHDTFARISRDKRHDSIVIVVDEPICQREFGEWSMGYAHVREQDVAELDGFSDFFAANQTLAQLSRGKTKRILRAFGQGRWQGQALPEPLTSAGAQV